MLLPKSSLEKHGRFRDPQILPLEPYSSSFHSCQEKNALFIPPKLNNWLFPCVNWWQDCMRKVKKNLQTTNENLNKLHDRKLITAERNCSQTIIIAFIMTTYPVWLSSLSSGTGWLAISVLVRGWISRQKNNQKSNWRHWKCLKFNTAVFHILFSKPGHILKSKFCQWIRKSLHPTKA